MYEIKTINSHNCDLKDSLDFLNELLLIQQEHVFSDTNPKNSFLLTVWSLKEIQTLLKHGSEIHFLIDDKKTIGYIVVSPIREFILQLPDASHTLNLSVFEKQSEWIYLYQAGIRKSYLKHGLGKELLSYVIAQYREKNIVADYMIKPYKNMRSEKLLISANFKTEGVLKFENYRGFKDSEWQVMFFLNKP